NRFQCGCDSCGWCKTSRSACQCNSWGWWCWTCGVSRNNCRCGRGGGNWGGDWCGRCSRRRKHCACPVNLGPPCGGLGVGPFLGVNPCDLCKLPFNHCKCRRKHHHRRRGSCSSSSDDCCERGCNPVFGGLP